jgi:hypothetical protein
MNAKSRIAETPTIFSPVLSLSTAICISLRETVGRIDPTPAPRRN